MWRGLRVTWPALALPTEAHDKMVCVDVVSPRSNNSTLQQAIRPTSPSMALCNVIRKITREWSRSLQSDGPSNSDA